MQLGFDNKKKVTWAIVIGIAGVVAFAYEVIPLLTTSPTATSSAQAAAPIPAPRTQGRAATKLGKQPRTENLDPTLRLDLLAASEKTQYQGNGRNIFVSQAEDIPQPKGPGHTDAIKPDEDASNAYKLPSLPPQPPIPLKFYGFASSPGEPKKIFLKLGEDVFVAGEGEIVDRRYKVVRISANSVEIQDVVNSGPPQNIPLTQG